MVERRRMIPSESVLHKNRFVLFLPQTASCETDHEAVVESSAVLALEIRTPRFVLGREDVFPGSLIHFILSCPSNLYMPIFSFLIEPFSLSIIITTTSQLWILSCALRTLSLILTGKNFAPSFPRRFVRLEVAL